MYDAVVVLGLKLGPNWELPNDIKVRLDRAAELFFTKQTKRIIVSGKWSIWFDWLGITPPVTEYQAMRHYLESKGIPKDIILVETHSKDTIGNIYELSKILRSVLYKNVAILCAEQHLNRVRYLCGEFIATGTNIAYLPIRSPHFSKDSTGDENAIFAEQQVVVKDLVDKLNVNPDYQIYDHPYYAQQATRVKKLLTTNPQLKLVRPALAPDLADKLLRN